MRMRFCERHAFGEPFGKPFRYGVGDGFAFILIVIQFELGMRAQLTVKRLITRADQFDIDGRYGL